MPPTIIYAADVLRDVRRRNPIFTFYRLRCTFPGCAGDAIIEQAMSSGLDIGYVIPENTSDPAYGRCPICKRYMMRVVEVADGPPEPPSPQGFSKIPEE